MPLISPTSSSGSTFGLRRWKMRNISAVQRPMPRMPTSSSMIASSSMSCQRAGLTAPERKCSARSHRYSTLRADRPAARICGASRSSTALGDNLLDGPEVSAMRRSHTACAALTEICWPTIERASVVKASPRLSSWPSEKRGISFFMTRSRLTRCLHASSQKSATSVGAAAVAAVAKGSALHPGRALGAVLEDDAEAGELVADRVGALEVARALGFGARADALGDLRLGERGAGLQERARRLLQEAERPGERLQERRVGGLAAAVDLGGELEQHGDRDRRVEVVV